MVLSATSIMTAWNIGSNRKWLRKRNLILYLTLGSSLSVRFARSHILMFSGQTESLIGSSMLSRISQLTKTSCFLNHLHLRRIVRGWYISFFQMGIRKFISLVVAMRVTLGYRTYQLVGATLLLSTMTIMVVFILKTIYLSLERLCLQNRQLNSNLRWPKQFKLVEVSYLSLLSLIYPNLLQFNSQSKLLNRLYIQPMETKWILQIGR